MAKVCLIAESDFFISRLLERFAETSGLQAVSAQVGQDVVEMAKRLQPQVIFLEPELPGKMRGWDVVRALREDKSTYSIPVIACSWLKREDIVPFFGEVQAFLHKPEIHYKDFVDALSIVGIRLDEPTSPAE